MVPLNEVLEWFNLADPSLDSLLVSDLGNLVLSRSLLLVSDTPNSGPSVQSSGLVFNYNPDFIQNHFGPRVAEIYLVVYPTGPFVYSSSLLESTATGVAILSTRPYDSVYRSLLPLYDFVRTSRTGYGVLSTPLSDGDPHPYEIREFPYSLVQALLDLVDQDPNAVAIPVTITVGGFATVSDTVQLDIAVSIAADVTFDGEVFSLSLTSGTIVASGLVNIPTSATALNEMYADAFIFGHPLTDGTMTGGGLPMSFKLHWTADGYEMLWGESLMSDPSEIMTGATWPTTMVGPALTTHPLSTATANVDQETLDTTEPLFVFTPELKFPVSISDFTPAHYDANEAISAFTIKADALYIPVVQGDQSTSTVDAWELFADIIRPAFSEAQARYILYGPILEFGDGSKTNPAEAVLLNWISRFESSYHLPPAGLVRGVVGGVVRAYPYLAALPGDANRFVAKRINPAVRTAAGYAVMGTMTMYPDDSSYKGHNYTMVLTRLVKRLILRILPRGLYESPNRLAELASAIEQQINSLAGVTLEIINISYDPATQTGIIEANLLLEGVLEAIHFTINIGFNTVEVNL